MDSLDFCATDTFQELFWRRRRDSQEEYLRLVAPLRPQQGDLADPSYLDFLCSVQLGLISELMRTGQNVFTERTGAEGTETTVRRDARFADNASLPEEYAVRVGNRLFEALRDGFEEEVFGGPTGCPTPRDFDCAVEGVRKLVAIFVSNGFAFAGAVSDVDTASRSFRVRVEGAATLYAASVLAAKGSSPPPAFLEYTIAAFLRASGWPAPSASMTLTRSAISTEWKLQ